DQHGGQEQRPEAARPGRPDDGQESTAGQQAAEQHPQPGVQPAQKRQGDQRAPAELAELAGAGGPVHVEQPHALLPGPGQSSLNCRRWAALSASLRRFFWSCLWRIWLPSTSTSRSVARKQRQASSGVQTIGSLRTLKLVLIITGQPVS